MVSIDVIVMLCLGKMYGQAQRSAPGLRCLASLGFYFCASTPSSWLQSAWCHGDPPSSLLGQVFIGMSESAQLGQTLNAEQG